MISISCFPVISSEAFHDCMLCQLHAAVVGSGADLAAHTLASRTPCWLPPNIAYSKRQKAVAASAGSSPGLSTWCAGNEATAGARLCLVGVGQQSWLEKDSSSQLVSKLNAFIASHFPCAHEKQVCLALHPQVFPTAPQHTRSR
jgi:hypothetical protein